MKTFITVLLLVFTTMTYGQNSEVDETTISKEQSIEDMIKPYVQKLLEASKKGADFVVQEVPIVVKQYLLYEAIYYLYLMLIGVGIFILGNLMLKKYISKGKAYNDLDRYNKSDYVFFNIITYVVSLPFIVFNILPFIKVVFLPKLYLMEHFINILR